MRADYSPMVAQEFPIPDFPWHQYVGGNVDSSNYGQNFRELSETFFLDLLGDDELPRPRFVGSGTGQGTFKCSDFEDKWDQFNCFRVTIFMNNLLDLRHKKL